MQILHPSTDSLRQFDLCAQDGEVAITCEIKATDGTYITDWWVSGLDSGNNLRVLARANFSMNVSSGKTPSLDTIRNTYDALVKPLVEASLRIAGMPQTLNAPEVTIKKLLCEAHLDLHAQIGNTGVDSIGQKVNVARQYQLIKSIGFKSAIPLIAAREGLKPTTILRRLDTAKAQGLLPKTEQPPHLRD